MIVTSKMLRVLLNNRVLHQMKPLHLIILFEEEEEVGTIIEEEVEVEEEVVEDLEVMKNQSKIMLKVSLQL